MFVLIADHTCIDCDTCRWMAPVIIQTSNVTKCSILLSYFPLPFFFPFSVIVIHLNTFGLGEFLGDAWIQNKNVEIDN